MWVYSVAKFVPFEGTLVRMLQAAVSNLPPIVAIPSHSKTTKSHFGRSFLHKDVKNEGRPGKVYENKGRGTKCTPKKRTQIHSRSHSCRNLQVFDRQIAHNCCRPSLIGRSGNSWTQCHAAGGLARGNRHWIFFQTLLNSFLNRFHEVEFQTLEHFGVQIFMHVGLIISG